MKRPAFQFYPGDWRKEPALSACSLAARGLWIEIMCIAHESTEYGSLSINGKAMTPAQLARMVGESGSTVTKLVAELEGAGVFSRDDKGAIYSRRMVKDERLRNVRAEAGRLGGNPDLLNQKDIQGVIPLLKQTPTPSSSSSSSSSDNLSPPGKPVVPDCPQLLLIDLFGKHLPTLPQPKPELWDGQRAKDLRSRWRWVLTATRRSGERYASTEAEALDWFDRFFGYVAGSDFLSGRNGKWSGCDLGWLVKADNFAKVVQGNYENKGAA